MKAISLVFGLLFIILGLTRLVVVFFENWKYRLTVFGEISVYWKCWVFIIVGLLLIRFTLLPAKPKKK